MDDEKFKLTQMHNGAVERAVDFRKMWAIAKKNWMVMRGDPVRLVPLFMFPIFMIIVFGYASGNIPKHIPAAIVDYDNSPFTHMLKDKIGAMELFTVKYMVGTQDEGKRLMDGGQIKVLFMSGYTNDAVVLHDLLEVHMPFLQKPFSPDVVARKVRDLLDRT